MIYLFALYMAVPAFVANLMPVLAARFSVLPRFSQPVHERYFGTNKTWRGFIVGIGCATITALLQWLIFAPHFSSALNALIFGVLAGTGALTGDLVKSFFKRLLGIKSGRPFIPFDQIDYMIGFLVFTYSLYHWGIQEAVFLIAFVLILNPLTNLLGYATGIKSTYW